MSLIKIVNFFFSEGRGGAGDTQLNHYHKLISKWKFGNRQKDKGQSFKTSKGTVAGKPLPMVTRLPQVSLLRDTESKESVRTLSIVRTDSESDSVRLRLSQWSLKTRKDRTDRRKNRVYKADVYNDRQWHLDYLIVSLILQLQRR